jgi:hypothetical protein
MFKPTLSILVLLSAALFSFGQNPEKELFTVSPRTSEPFLYSVTSLTAHDLKWSFDYSGTYGENVPGSLGYEGVSQQFAVKGYLGKQFTLYANASLGFPGENEIASAQQVEVLRNFIGGKKSTGIALGWGIGVRRDFTNVKSILSRGTLSFNTDRWRLNGNALFEKAFASNRDAVDVIFCAGVHYNFAPGFYGGVEAIGEDLEGFWDKEEAEGGAKLLVGPSLNLVPKKSRFSFSVSGGPVFYATQNQMTNPDAIRELPKESGLMIKARVVFNLSGS